MGGDNTLGGTRARFDRLTLLRKVAVALAAGAAIATWLAPSLYARERVRTAVPARGRGRAAVVTALAALAAAFGAGAVGAQGNDVFVAAEAALAERLSTTLADAADLPGMTTIRRRLVRVDTDLLELARLRAPAGDAGFPGVAADAPLLTLRLFDDIELSGVVERVEPTATGLGYALFGQLKRSDGDDDDTTEWDMTLLVYGETVAGTIRTASELYEIRSVDGDVHAITQIEPSLPSDDPPLVPPPSSGLESRAAEADAPIAGADDGSVIDVAVFYTPAAQRGASRLSSVSGIAQLVDLLFADTNSALRASRVNLRMNLVRLQPEPYTESDSSRTDLMRLQSNGDGHLDAVHSVRDTYRADLVHLLTDESRGRTSFSCGRAYISVPRSTGEYGFGITDYRCTSNYTFAHELGHNLGLHHDRYQTIDAENRTFDYFHGYVNQRAFRPGAPERARWRTIMSYDLQCDEEGWSSLPGRGYSCEPLRYYSNPNNTYRGDPMGVSAGSFSTGVEGPADASRRIREMQRTVANFRERGGTTGGGPDLVVQSAAVSDSTLTSGQSFTFSATVANRGDATSPATTLNYGRRPRGSGSFSRVDSDSVGGLRPSGTSRESARLTAPTLAGSYEYMACVLAVSGESDTRNNCSNVVSVTVRSDGGGGCTTDLGRVSGAVRRTGSWDGSCDSVLRPGRHARYYSFTLAGSSPVTIDLASSFDTYMALRAGSGTSGRVIETDDDGGPGANSRITRTLSAGTYTIEATTYLSGRTGSFTLTLMVEGGGAGCTTDLGRVSGTVRRTGSWDGSCDSVLRPGRHARYYSFTLAGSSPVTIDLASSFDTYMALRAGSGTSGRVIETDDDGGPGANSRITRTLSAGTYTIEATTYLSGRTGSFTLTLMVEGGGAGCTTDLGRVSGTVRRTGSWDGSCDSVLRPGRHARYYSFTLAGSSPVTIDLASSFDTYMALRAGSGTSGRVIETDDDGGPGANSRITRTLSAGTYTIEATTYLSGRTGSFTLTLAVGAGGTGPNLVVQSPAVSNATLTPGQAFTFSATVRNQGDRASAPATLTYRQRRAGGSWTVVGTDSVSGLSPAASSDESIGLNAPAQAGTYEYGACVSPVTGESDTANNCSVAVRVVVESGPDLVVDSPTVSESSLISGQSFTLSARVRNQGGSASAAATLTFRRRRAGGAWTTAGTASVGGLSPSGVSSESIGLTAPAEAAAYEYGACVSSVTGESDTGNNCSGETRVVVEEPPDLVVETPTVSDGSLTSGESFTLSARVRNQGGSASEAATLTYRRRRSGGAWIAEGTDPVGRLSPSGTSQESIGLTAPTQAGAYEYGACVSTVRWETETDNNCSDPVQVKVCTVDRLGSVTLGRRAVGSWGSGCESTNRTGRYARYYSFVLTRAVEVQITLSSSQDTYLFLLAGSGTDGRVVASNDDIGVGDLDSRIVRTLSAGTYTVEATTFGAGLTGSFALRVSERRPFVDDPIEAGLPIRAVHLTELRGRIDELRVSAGLPRYSWADRTIRPGVTPVRAAHWEQLRTALDQAYDADGRRRPGYTDEIEVGVPIEADHVNELRRAVEGL